MKTHLHGALRADRGQHEQQRGVRQPAWPVRWAGLLLSARHHNKQPSPRVTPALPMSQGKDKEPVRGLPVRIKANRKKNRRRRGWRTEPGSKGWERVGGQKTGTCKRLRREQGKLQNCREDSLRSQIHGPAAGRWQRANEVRWGSMARCMRAAQVHLAPVGKYARNGIMGGQRRGARNVRTGAGGLISVERAQQWCWMALEVNYT